MSSTVIYFVLFLIVFSWFSIHIGLYSFTYECHRWIQGTQDHQFTHLFKCIFVHAFVFQLYLLRDSGKKIDGKAYGVISLYISEAKCLPFL